MAAILCLLLLTFCCGPANAEPRLLVVGDSLSAGYGLAAGQGWVDLLEQRMRAEGYPHRIINASVSGDTTGNGLARLPRALETHQPQVVVLELGGNDGLRGLPIRAISNNLDRMLTLATASGARTLLVAMHIPPNYGPAYAGAFSALYPKLAERHGIPLAPFLLEGVALDRSLMQRDGIHPTAAAQPLILDNIWPHLEPLLTLTTAEALD